MKQRIAAGAMVVDGAELLPQAAARGYIVEAAFLARLGVREAEIEYPAAR